MEPEPVHERVDGLRHAVRPLLDDAPGRLDGTGRGRRRERDGPLAHVPERAHGRPLVRGALPQSERLNETPLYQENDLRAAFFWGHSANSISEMGKMQQAMQNLDLLVVVDVFPSVASVLPDRDDGVIILPASSQYEHYRSLTNSHRSIQWSEPVRPPSHNSRPDLRIIQELAAKLGEYDYWDGLGAHFDWGSGPNIHNGKSTYEEVIREINIGLRTIGYIQSPERLQQHLDYDYAFSTETLKAEEQGLPVSDEFWGLPWPCWGEGHPGTPIIWNDDMDPRNGGQDFRARWGTQAPTPDDWDGMNTDKPYPMQDTVDAKGVEEGTNLLRDELVPENWESDYQGVINGVPEYPGWKTVLPEDLTNPDALSLPYQYALDPNESVYTLAQELVSRGMEEHVVQPGMNVEESLEWWEQYDYKQPDAPTGRGRARATVWNFIDTVPVHREPIESPRPDLVEQWPANGQQKNFYRFDQNNSVTQEDAMQKVADQGLNTIMTTGRQVEHQGGGSETRSNEMTADLQPHMYAEITPATAEDLDVDGGDMLIVSSTDRGSILVKARVTDRPNDSETFLPFHWGGVFKGQSLEDRYPEGTVPYAIGDSVNAITSRGYDVETQMQETKVSMVRLEPATEQRMEELNMEVIDFPQDRDGIGLQKDFDVRDSETVQ
nr:formate dehydrogenase subunit alpha [Halosegnis sp. DT85]